MLGNPHYTYTNQFLHQLHDSQWQVLPVFCRDLDINIPSKFTYLGQRVISSLWAYTVFHAKQETTSRTFIKVQRVPRKSQPSQTQASTLYTAFRATL